CDGAVAIDADECVRCECRRRRGRAAGRFEPEAEQQRAARGEARLEERAARRRRQGAGSGKSFGLHSTAAAFLIALRMRTYVPQRQMLPAIAASMSASSGDGFDASSAAADMIWPDWQ